MNFFLGTHEVHWLGQTTVPLFISRRRLDRLIALPRAIGDWALDSGGFSELSLFGEWRTSEDTYVHNVGIFADEIGGMQWAAPMDWMCEPHMLAKTGGTVYLHQLRTVTNFVRLQGRGPFIPVLQGWDLDDYLRCIDLYDRHGVDLFAEPVVGIGSVCRRQDTDEISRIVKRLWREGLSLHGFGVKTLGLDKYQDYLTSCDSASWSYAARRRKASMQYCSHATCQNCIRYALCWRRRMLNRL